MEKYWRSELGWESMGAEMPDRCSSSSMGADAAAGDILSEQKHVLRCNDGLLVLAPTAALSPVSLGTPLQGSSLSETGVQATR